MPGIRTKTKYILLITNHNITLAKSIFSIVSQSTNWDAILLN